MENKNNPLDLFSNKGQGGDSYNKYRPPYHQGLINRLIDLSKDKKTYLDIAAGTGQIFLKLFNLFELAVANDISSLQLNALETNLKSIPNTTITKVICCDALDLGEYIPNQKFDIITIAAAFHWFDQDKLLTYIKTCLLNTDGKVFIIGYTCPDIYYKSKDGSLYEKITDYLNNYKKEVTSNSPKDIVDKNLEDIKKYDYSKFFENVEYEEWETVVTFTVEEYIGFLKTWSVYPIYINNNRDKCDFKDPTEIFVEELEGKFGKGECSIDMPITYFHYILT
jgi:ubiquinone/menaquinone biosynthesis C-methylase UbiE